MTPEAYNHARLMAGELTAFDVHCLLLRWRPIGNLSALTPARQLTHAVRALQGKYALRTDGKCGPVTTAELPTRKLRQDAESLIALALHATAGRQYVFGVEVARPECRLLTWGEAVAALRPVRAWDCSELIEVIARMLGVTVAGKPLMDGTWRQYGQLAASGRDVHPRDSIPGDLVFEFRDKAGQPVIPGEDRPSRAHVGIVLNWQRDTIEAAPDGCGPHPARATWTHAARLLP